MYKNCINFLNQLKAQAKLLVKFLRSLCAKFFLLYILIGSILVLENNVSLAGTPVDEFTSTQDGAASDILDILTSITCETQGIGNIIRSDNDNTCISKSLFDSIGGLMSSPIYYPGVLLRLNIKDGSAFSDSTDPKELDMCSRQNRVPYNEWDVNGPDAIENVPLAMSYSMCSNPKLALNLTTSIITNIAPAVGAAVINGDNVWDAIKDAWVLKKSDYHEIYPNNPDGEEQNSDFGFFPTKVEKIKDSMCVSTRQWSKWVPVGCKYIKEPMPISIYSDFFGIEPQFGDDELNKLTNLTRCSNADRCYTRAYNASHTPTVMTGPIIECVKEMMAKMMISRQICGFNNIESSISVVDRSTSSLFRFQQNMHLFVTALLTLYVIFFGFKIILGGQLLPKSEMVGFLLTFLFVTYFAVGINVNSLGVDQRLDGISQWALPFLLNAIDSLGSWVINASPSGLCDFSDAQYPDGLVHLRLWDSLDCKVSHYLGIDAIQTMLVDNASKVKNFAKLDTLSYPLPPYIYLLVPALIMGNITLVKLSLIYPLLVISVAAFVVNATVVCMIAIVVLSVLAPLFVPMFLFKYTRPIFDSWLRLLISFTLQPMVAIVFMTTMFSVYDMGFYGQCKYSSKDFSYENSATSIPTNLMNIVNGSVVDLNSDDSRSVRSFYVNDDWEDTDLYPDEEAVESCQYSLGYILNNPEQSVLNFAEDIGGNVLDKFTEFKDNKEKSDLEESFGPVPGMFFGSVEMVFEKIVRFIISLLTACFTLYLMYHFSSQMSGFVADMTEGISTQGMSIGAQTGFKAGYAAISAAGSAAGASGGDGKGAGGGNSEDGGDGDKEKDNDNASSRKGAKDMQGSGGKGSASSKKIAIQGGASSAGKKMMIKGKQNKNKGSVARTSSTSNNNN